MHYVTAGFRIFWMNIIMKQYEGLITVYETLNQDEGQCDIITRGLGCQ